jgi:hypothetical protein
LNVTLSGASGHFDGVKVQVDLDGAHFGRRIDVARRLIRATVVQHLSITKGKLAPFWKVEK